MFDLTDFFGNVKSYGEGKNLPELEYSIYEKDFFFANLDSIAKDFIYRVIMIESSKASSGLTYIRAFNVVKDISLYLYAYNISNFPHSEFIKETCESYLGLEKIDTSLSSHGFNVYSFGPYTCIYDSVKDVVLVFNSKHIDIFLMIYDSLIRPRISG